MVSLVWDDKVLEVAVQRPNVVVLTSPSELFYVYVSKLYA